MQMGRDHFHSDNSGKQMHNSENYKIELAKEKEAQIDY